MRLYFQHPALDAQLQRLMGQIYFGHADIGESLTTAARIEESNLDSWYHEWSATADRLMIEGQNSEEAGCLVSAREAYMRASNYYRTALYFLYEAPVQEKLLETYHKHASAFSKAARLFTPAFEGVKIPYEGTFLPGYFYKVDNSPIPRPTLIVNGGYDSTHQEAYFHIVNAALHRGYNVFAFDGPGQGALLLLENLYMRPDWEAVISPVVDYLTTRKEVDSKKIALYGPSWGGMLAPRAAAYEHRLAALAVNPGQYDVLLTFKQAIQSQNGEETQFCDNVDALLQAAMSDKFVAAKFKAKMFVHGKETPHELFEEWKKYNLVEAAPLIRCPTFIGYSENENLCPGQAQLLFDALCCPKVYEVFTNTEGAGEHCAAGASGLFTQRLFGWLDAICFPTRRKELGSLDSRSQDETNLQDGRMPVGVVR